MPAELEEGLARLAHVEDADGGGVGGEGGEEVGVVWGCGDAEEGRGVGHCLLGCCWGHVAGACGCESVSFVG